MLQRDQSTSINARLDIQLIYCLEISSGGRHFRKFPLFVLQALLPALLNLRQELISCIISQSAAELEVPLPLRGIQRIPMSASSGTLDGGP